MANRRTRGVVSGDIPPALWHRVLELKLTQEWRALLLELKANRNRAIPKKRLAQLLGKPLFHSNDQQYINARFIRGLVPVRLKVTDGLSIMNPGTRLRLCVIQPHTNVPTVQPTSDSAFTPAD